MPTAVVVGAGVGALIGTHTEVKLDDPPPASPKAASAPARASQP